MFATGVTTGNDNIRITGCDIGPAGTNYPTNCIFSLGTSITVDNSSDTLDNNKIHDFYSNTLPSFGIHLNNTNASSSNNWLIDNNKLYQTVSRAYTTANTHQIVVLGTGAGHVCSNNTIGFASSTGTGTYTISSGTGLTRLVGITVNNSDVAGTPISVQGNTISGISISSANTSATTTATFIGINLNAGNANIGTVTGNTIGATTGTGSIAVIATASGGGAVAICNQTAGTINISNNNIGSMSVTSSTAANALGLYGVFVGAVSSSLTVNNNTIGNSTTNNLVAGTLAFTTAVVSVAGIAGTSSPTSLNYNNNTIQNLASYTTGTTAASCYVKGIVTPISGTTTAATIYSNTIRNLTTTSGVTGATSGYTSAAGIHFASGLNATIYQNTIYNISNTSTVTTNTIVAGVSLAVASSTNVYNNKIYGLTNAGTGTTATAPPVAAGILIRSGVASALMTVYNNMITLGNAQTSNTVFIGIWGNHGSTPDPLVNVYHNSVSIEGTVTSGALPSFCFNRGDLSATVRSQVYDIKNNIFTNSRSGGTGGHYAISNCFGATGVTTGWTSNNNILNSASPSTVGYHAAGAKTFAAWQSAMGDANSYTAATVTYTNTATGDLHINMGTAANQIESQGDATVGIATDFDGDARPGPVGSIHGGGTAPDLGADEWDGSIIYSCTTPAANSVNASIGSVTCFGTTTNLTLANAVSGTGNTYQWQLSTDGTNYSDISGAISNAYTAAPAAPNNYYRCVVTCANGPASTTSSSLLITGPSQLAAGTYTINSGVATGGTNYNTFTDAFADLSCKGIAGPVVFNVASGSGPYVEQATLNVVGGSSAINTITINGNGATLSFNSTLSASRAGITLNGADYVTIDDLIIDGTAGTYGWGVLLTNGADYNTISNCTINVSTTSITSTNHYPIVISGSTTSPTTSGVNGSNNTFTGNILSGGYYGIVMYGSSTASLYNSNNTISNNTITGAYLYSIYCIYQKNATISGNDISRSTRSTISTTAGVYFTTGGGGNLIEKNRIHNMFDAAVSTNTSTFYGIYIAADGTVGNENKVINNLVYKILNSNGAQYGLYNSGAAFCQAYHNTFVFSDVNSTAGLAYGIYQTTAVTGLEFKNNLIYITRGGTGTKRCIYFATTTSTITSSNNNFYLNPSSGTDNAIGNFGTTIFNSISDWKTANTNAYDQNSVSVNPQFVDQPNNDFTPNAGAMDDLGTYVGVTTDILGNSRSNSVPDIGAIEFTGAGCTDPPTPGTATSSNSFACTGVSFTLDVSGNSSGPGQEYQWQISTDNTNWTNIGSVSTTSSYVTSQTSTNYYRVGMTCSGGSTAYSTSKLVNTSSQLSGNYTINKNIASSSTNFQSITEAINSMSCGITGPVTFNVVANSGPYNEQITIPAISGASSTNTVTLNGNGNSIIYSSSNTSLRAGFTLNDADYIKINNFIIDGSAGTYAWGVHLTNGADYNTISNCTINVGANTSTTNFGGIIFSNSVSSPTTSGNSGNYDTIIGNRVIGGYYGISLYGNSTGNCLNNSVINNIVEDAYTYNIYAVYQNSARIIGNEVKGLNRTTFTTNYCIYLSTGSTNCLVDKNKIHDLYAGTTSNTSSTYALYGSGTPTAGNENIFSNNIVYNIDNSGAVYSMYLATNYIKVYHNTFVLNNAASTAGSTYGLYQSSSYTNLDVKNNLVYITRGGTGTKSCVYISSAGASSLYNYNNYYMNAPAGTNYIAQLSSTYTTLAAWQAGNTNGYDVNSVSIDPLFVDAVNNDYTPNSGQLDNLGTNLGITSDILGNVRSNTTPDIGAFEFTGAGCMNPPTPGNASSSSSFACIGIPFNLDLSGNSFGTGQTYQWQMSTDNTNWSNIGSAQSTTSYSTTQSVAHYYRAAITCSGGTTVYSSSIYINTPLSISGTYTINKNAAPSSTNFQSITAAVDAMGCGITGPVVFNVVSNSGPYNEVITIPVISGASSTNTVTFNGNGNTIYNKFGASTPRTGVTLNGADHIVLNNFIINVADSTYGWGVWFTNAADSNIVTNCTILTSTTQTANHYPIVFSGSATSATTSGNNGNYNTVTNCTLTGGAYNVSLYGNSTTGAENIGNTISNNIMTDAYIYSMYVLYQKNLTIRGNDISRPTRTASSTISGMYLSTSAGGGYVIEKNIIHNMNDMQPASTSTCYGIYMGADAPSYSSPNRVQNNLIFNLGGNGSVYGIYNSTGLFNQIYHNTLILNSNTATSGATYGIYQTGAASVDIKNNIVSVSRSGTGIKRCLHFVTTTSTISCNYNDLLMDATTGSDNNIGTFGTTAYATLTDWKTANTSSFDQNSYSIQPSFADVANNNYKPTNVLLNHKGTYVGVIKDILDSTRSNTTPDIGAYEFNVNSCTGTPTAGSVVINSTIICSGNSLNLDLTGNTTGIGITYQWQYSTDNTNWSNLTSMRSAASLDTTQTITRYYRAAVSCNNATPVYTTSVFATTPALVSGTFTINSNLVTSGSNFQTFAEAISYMSCGINGPVTFNVVANSGPYSEQVNIPVINGASSINKVTFNGNGNTISFNSSLTSNRAGFTLNGADYITINNFSINGTSGTYGWGVFLTNQADYNIISNCTITVGENATSSNFAGIVMSASFTSATTTGTVGSYNTITNNTIIGGYYGVVACGGSTNLGVNNQVTNNILRDQYFYATYNIYQSGELVSNNDIFKLNRTTITTGYGCYLTTGVTNSRFEKNKIHNIFNGATTGTSIFYGFYVAGDGTAGNENKIINNLIYDINNNGTNYGIYNTTGAYMQAYHNTIVFNGTAATTGTTYGIYQTGAIAGFDIRNNNIYITRSGTGIKRCVYYVTTTSTITSNNNNFYLNAVSGTDNKVAQFGTTSYITLAAWNTGTVYDANSISIDPQFVNPTSSNYLPTNTALNIGASVGVADDILGGARSSNSTTGAYQIDVTPPSISYTTLLGDCGPSQSSSRTLSGVVITDATGVPTSGGTIPRIYFKKGMNGTWVSSAGNLTSGNATNGTWSFTISYASISGLANGDSIYYYVVAQDINANVGSLPSGIVATSVNNITVHPTGNYFRTITYTPSITISTASTTVCSGSNVNFTSSIVDGGSSPSYVWRKNGFNVGGGSSIGFLAGTLTNNDVITCELTANNTCQTSATANSNSIILTVNPSPVIGQITNSAGTVITTATMCSLGVTVRYFDTTYAGTWSSSNSLIASVTSQGVVTSNINGTATISYSKSSNGGCVSSSSVLVTVAKEPTPNAISGNNSICVGGTTNLSTTTSGGVWASFNVRGTINGSGVYTGTVAGTGDVRYTTTNANGCSAYVSYPVIVNAIPNVPTINYAPGTVNPQAGAPSGSYCVGKIFTVVGTPTGGVWTSTGVASITSGGVVTIISTGIGSIKYTYTTAAGCTNSRTISGNGFTCAARGVDLSNESQKFDFSLFPNPAKTKVNMTVETLFGFGKIVISDIYGKELQIQNLSLGNNQIDISKLSKGLYFISTVTNDGKTTKKLIVE